MDRTDPAVYFCGQMKNAMRNNLLVAMLLILSGQVYAQSNDIQGKVIDQKTGEPLVGATVKHVTSGKMAITDFDGQFLLESVRTGLNEISISYVSYEEASLKRVVVEEGVPTSLNIKMRRTGTGTPGNSFMTGNRPSDEPRT